MAANAAQASVTRAAAIRVLQLEDNAVDAELVARQLVDDGLDIVCRIVATEGAFRSAIGEFAPNIVLSDFSLPGFDGLSALQIAKEMIPDTPFIFVSGTIGEERAIEALKRGAVDYVLKDNLRRLVPAIKGALRQAEATRAKDLAEQMLRRSESRLQAIIDTSRDWIWECDREGRFTFSSPSVLDILGYKHHEMLGRRATEYVDPTDELQLQATFGELDTSRELAKPVTLRWRHKSGRTRWLERSMVALRDEHGAVTGARGIDRDVTLRMAQEVKIRRLNRALRFVSGASSAMMRMREREQLVKESCRLAVSVGGYAKATLYLLPTETGGKPIVCSYGSRAGNSTKWSLGERLPEGSTPVTQALATAQPVVLNDLSDTNDIGIRVPDRAALLETGLRSCSAVPLIMEGRVIGVLELNADEAGVFGEAELALLKQVAANITFSLQYLQSKESAEYLEYFDPLTSLANRSLYVQRLALAIEDAAANDRRVALLVLDVSELGMINDGLGHHAGDLLLQLIAERLKNVFRDTSAVCRLGGDRFAVMADGATADVATALKERVACVFDVPFTIHERELRMTIRAGLAQSPDDASDAEALLQHAQTALAHAKQGGERYLRHQPGMNASASQRLSLINELRRAVAERRFILHYQPKVDIVSGCVNGVEALLRWPPEQGDAVPPNVFVPMLESLGLIDEIGGWVIVQALSESAGWQPEANGGFRVAVNVSPLQLNREDFAERVLELGTGLIGGLQRLEIEVTESTLMADPRRASASLALLREAGVSIAIDDFGTGHSSLRVLSRLPVDVLKIDRSFVRDLPENRNHRVIVQTTITLADSLGLKTVAEGVETQDQLEILRELGCSSIQGYWVRKPASAAEFTKWFRSSGAAKLASVAPRELGPAAAGSAAPLARTRRER